MADEQAGGVPGWRWWVSARGRLRAMRTEPLTAGLIAAELARHYA
jgi:hypothetical protein